MFDAAGGEYMCAGQEKPITVFFLMQMIFISVFSLFPIDHKGIQVSPW